jgi:hypothetical protein
LQQLRQSTPSSTSSRSKNKIYKVRDLFGDDESDASLEIEEQV